jgi:hypothetical protein
MDCTGRGTRMFSAGLLGLMLATAGLLAIVLLDSRPALAEPADSGLTLTGPGDQPDTDAANFEAELQYELGTREATALPEQPPVTQSAHDGSGSEGSGGQGGDTTPRWAYVAPEQPRTRQHDLAFSQDSLPDDHPLGSVTPTAAASGAEHGIRVAQVATDAPTKEQRLRDVTIFVRPEALVTQTETPVTVSAKYDSGGWETTLPKRAWEDRPLPVDAEVALSVSPASIPWKGVPWKSTWEVRRVPSEEPKFVADGPEAQVTLPDRYPAIFVRYVVDKEAVALGTPVDVKVLPVLGDFASGWPAGVAPSVTVTEVDGPSTTVTGGEGDMKVAYAKEHVVTVDPVARRQLLYPDPYDFWSTELRRAAKVVVRDVDDDHPREIPMTTSPDGRPSFRWSPMPGDVVRILYEAGETVPSTWPEFFGRLSKYTVDQVKDEAERLRSRLPWGSR